MRLSRRIILAIYGLAVAFVLTWVPWRANVEAQGRKITYTLACGLIWSLPKPPAATIQYEAALHEYLTPKPSSVPVPDWRSGIVPKSYSGGPPPGYVEVPPPESSPPEGPAPKVPEDYIESSVYRFATVDYGRVLLEFGALTGLLLMVWMITPSVPSTKDQS
jgi:hypothetical protein